MSIPVLVEVYDEMRRLAIAGSAVAPGDFRLKKLIPPLEASGQKAPVFAKVAQAVGAVVESNEKTASTALLDLTTLVNAILYTQGETGIAGEFKPLETTDLGGQPTQASARVLKPLLEALSTTGSGRLELIRDAYERGTFKDLRLIRPALRGLDDPYPEISQLIAEKILPMYGKTIIPELRATLDIKGRGGHQQRLQLLHRLDPEGTRELVQQTLSEGSKEMKVAAIECLGTSDDDLVYLLEQAKAKAKDVRAAALRALAMAGTSSTTVMTALKKAIDGPDLEMIIPRVQECSLPEIRTYVLQQAEVQLSELLKLKDKKLQGAAVARMQHLVSCLDRRKDAEAEAFLLKCMAQAPAIAGIKSEPSGADLNELIAHVMARGTTRMQKQLAGAYKTFSGPMLSSAFLAARATMSPADFYAEFSPTLKAMKDKRKRADAERGEALAGVLTSAGNLYLYRPWMGMVGHDRGTIPVPELDSRWLDAAIEAQAEELACALARPGHAGLCQFLSEQLAKHKGRPHERFDLLQTMVKAEHPEAADAIIAALKQDAKDSSGYYWGYWYGRMIPDLPKSALPKFEALLPTLPDKMVDGLMESVLALKNK